MVNVRARENGVPFVAANKAGVELGAVAYCGKSTIVAADGTTRAREPASTMRRSCSATSSSEDAPRRGPRQRCLPCNTALRRRWRDPRERASASRSNAIRWNSTRLAQFGAPADVDVILAVGAPSASSAGQAADCRRGRSAVCNVRAARTMRDAHRPTPAALRIALVGDDRRPRSARSRRKRRSAGRSDRLANARRSGLADGVSRGRALLNCAPTSLRRCRRPSAPSPSIPTAASSRARSAHTGSHRSCTNVRARSRRSSRRPPTSLRDCA